ncbi:hypothetical protein GCM10023231_20310 [Olivibacter ginsenosidimutans]|uniref:GntP family permease n=1 Tax=Olivibacter ginsenosidimutans TaxID=1176537 RepID=A0ABP9B8X7_9SPHI
MTDQLTFLQSAIGLIAGILFIILLTVHYRIHAFFALFAACLLVGLVLQIPLTDNIRIAKEGFGQVVGSLALLIVLGTTLGMLLAHTHSTMVIANFILSIVGARRSALAMNISGFLVGMPIFCDSGFLVLNGLNKALAMKSGTSMLVMASSLATGLYAVHCLMPPHPGIAATTETIQADFGSVLFYGLLMAIPAAFCGYLWSRYAGMKIVRQAIVTEDEGDLVKQHPTLLFALLPIVVPIGL